MHTDWSLFFGRFHPLLVHIPIGIILFAALLQAVAVFAKSRVTETALDIALLAGAIGAITAAISGYFLSASGSYDVNTLFWHKWTGIAIAVLTSLTWLIKKNTNKLPASKKQLWSRVMLLLCVVLIGIGGHLGGNMTHGENYLTTYMPSFLKSFFGNKKIVEDKQLPVLDSVVVYQDIIRPIFLNKCAGCHNAGKKAGELNLTDIEGIQKGGKSGSAIIAGDLEKSELYRRITLPAHSSKFMPADARPPLLPIETSLIRDWILSGADYTKNITVAAASEKEKFLLACYLGIDENESEKIVLPVVAAADTNVTRELKGLKLAIHQLTSASNLLEVSFVMVQGQSLEKMQALLEKLSIIRAQVYRLDVSHCNLDFRAMQLLGNFSRLNKLDLQKNNLADGDLLPLQNLQALTILNAGQNPLTDKSIGTFKKLASLKKLNLWQTQVTNGAIKELGGVAVVL